jgi:hypothetical protein
MSPGIEISKRLVLINSASTVIKSVLGLSILFWVQRHLVESVSPEEYKVLVLVFPLLLFVPLLTMTVGGGVGRFVIEAYAKGDTKRVTQITSTLFPLTILVGALVFLIGGILVWKIQPVLNLAPEYTNDARIMFAILVGSAGVRATLIPFFVGLEVKQKFLFRNVLGLGLELLRIALLLSLLFGVSTRVIWLVVATVPGSIIDIIVSFTYSRRLVPALRFDRREIRRELIAPIVHFGGWTLVARAAAIAREASAGLFLSHFSSAIQLQAYRLGAYVETRFYPTVLSPLLTLQPALTGMFAKGEEARLRRTYFRVSRYILWTFLFFAVPGMIFHREIWEVWLEPESAARLADGSIVMVLLFAKSFFVFPQPALAQIALAKARHGPMALRSLLIEGSTVALTFYVVWGRGYGAVGLAAAMLAVSAIGTPLLHWTYGFKLTEAKLGDWLRDTMKPGLLPAAVATPVWFACAFLFDASVWWQLFLAGALGCAVYAATLLRFCLTPDERVDVGKVVAKARARIAR